MENHIFSNSVPQAVLVLQKILPSVPKNVFISVLKAVIDTMKQKPLPAGAIERIGKQSGISDIDHLFAGVLMLMQAITRLPNEDLKQNYIKQDLKELKFPEEHAECIAQVVFGSPEQLQVLQQRGRLSYYSKLDKFSWRIDISLSSHALSRTIDTIIIFQLQLKKEKTKSFEVNLSKFHQLRFFVASMLKELEIIEKKALFKT